MLKRAAIGIGLVIFLVVGLMYASWQQRRIAQLLEWRERAQGDLDSMKDRLNDWTEEEFRATCISLRGLVDLNQQLCQFNDGRKPMKYQRIFSTEE